MDDLDLYEDLDAFQEQQERKSKELQDVEEKYQHSLKTIQGLEDENKTLKKKIQRIELSFQSLLDTARTEIKRKDKEIERLRKEKDDICFRRKFPNRPQETESRPFKQIVRNSFAFSAASSSVPATSDTQITDDVHIHANDVASTAVESESKERGRPRDRTDSQKRHRSREANKTNDNKRHRREEEHERGTHKEHRRERRKDQQDHLTENYNRDRCHDRNRYDRDRCDRDFKYKDRKKANSSESPERRDYRQSRFEKDHRKEPRRQRHDKGEHFSPFKSPARTSSDRKDRVKDRLESGRHRDRSKDPSSTSYQTKPRGEHIHSTFPIEICYNVGKQPLQSNELDSKPVTSNGCQYTSENIEARVSAKEKSTSKVDLEKNITTNKEESLTCSNIGNDNKENHKSKENSNEIKSSRNSYQAVEKNREIEELLYENFDGLREDKEESSHQNTDTTCHDIEELLYEDLNLETNEISAEETHQTKSEQNKKQIADLKANKTDTSNNGSAVDVFLYNNLKDDEDPIHKGTPYNLKYDEDPIHEETPYNLKYNEDPTHKEEDHIDKEPAQKSKDPFQKPLEMGTPHKAALFDALFGPSPSSDNCSDSNNSKNLFNNIMGILSKTKADDKSNTTSPGDYSASVVVATTPPLETDKVEQQRFDRNAIDKYFTKNEGTPQGIGTTIDLTDENVGNGVERPGKEANVNMENLSTTVVFVKGEIYENFKNKPTNKSYEDSTNVDSDKAFEFPVNTSRISSDCLSAIRIPGLDLVPTDTHVTIIREPSIDLLTNQSLFTFSAVTEEELNLYSTAEQDHEKLSELSGLVTPQSLVKNSEAQTTTKLVLNMSEKSVYGKTPQTDNLPIAHVNIPGLDLISLEPASIITSKPEESLTLLPENQIATANTATDYSLFDSLTLEAHPTLSPNPLSNSVKVTTCISKTRTENCAKQISADRAEHILASPISALPIPCMDLTTPEESCKKGETSLSESSSPEVLDPKESSMKNNITTEKQDPVSNCAADIDKELYCNKTQKSLESLSMESTFDDQENGNIPELGLITSEARRSIDLNLATAGVTDSKTFADNSASKRDLLSPHTSRSRVLNSPKTNVPIPCLDLTSPEVPLSNKSCTLSTGDLISPKSKMPGETSANNNSNVKLITQKECVYFVPNRDTIEDLPRSGLPLIASEVQKPLATNLTTVTISTSEKPTKECTSQSDSLSAVNSENTDNRLFTGAIASESCSSLKSTDSSVLTNKVSNDEINHLDKEEQDISSAQDKVIDVVLELKSNHIEKSHGFSSRACGNSQETIFEGDNQLKTSKPGKSTDFPVNHKMISRRIFKETISQPEVIEIADDEDSESVEALKGNLEEVAESIANEIFKTDKAKENENNKGLPDEVVQLTSPYIEKAHNSSSLNNMTCNDNLQEMIPKLNAKRSIDDEEFNSNKIRKSNDSNETSQENISEPEVIQIADNEDSETENNEEGEMPKERPGNLEEETESDVEQICKADNSKESENIQRSPETGNISSGTNRVSDVVKQLDSIQNDKSNDPFPRRKITADLIFSAKISEQNVTDELQNSKTKKSDDSFANNGNKTDEISDTEVIEIADDEEAETQRKATNMNEVNGNVEESEYSKDHVCKTDKAAAKTYQETSHLKANSSEPFTEILNTETNGRQLENNVTLNKDSNMSSVEVEDRAINIIKILSLSKSERTANDIQLLQQDRMENIVKNYTNEDQKTSNSKIISLESFTEDLNEETNDRQHQNNANLNEESNISSVKVEDRAIDTKTILPPSKFQTAGNDIQLQQDETANSENNNLAEEQNRDDNSKNEAIILQHRDSSEKVITHLSNATEESNKKRTLEDNTLEDNVEDASGNQFNAETMESVINNSPISILTSQTNKTETPIVSQEEEVQKELTFLDTSIPPAKGIEATDKTAVLSNNQLKCINKPEQLNVFNASLIKCNGNSDSLLPPNESIVGSVFNTIPDFLNSKLNQALQNYKQTTRKDEKIISNSEITTSCKRPPSPNVELIFRTTCLPEKTDVQEDSIVSLQLEKSNDLQNVERKEKENVSNTLPNSLRDLKDPEHKRKALADLQRHEDKHKEDAENKIQQLGENNTSKIVENIEVNSDIDALTHNNASATSSSKCHHSSSSIAQNKNEIAYKELSISCNEIETRIERNCSSINAEKYESQNLQGKKELQNDIFISMVVTEEVHRVETFDASTLNTSGSKDLACNKESTSVINTTKPEHHIPACQIPAIGQNVAKEVVNFCAESPCDIDDKKSNATPNKSPCNLNTQESVCKHSVNVSETKQSKEGKNVVYSNLMPANPKDNAASSSGVKPTPELQYIQNTVIEEGTHSRAPKDFSQTGKEKQELQILCHEVIKSPRVAESLQQAENSAKNKNIDEKVVTTSPISSAKTNFKQKTEVSNNPKTMETPEISRILLISPLKAKNWVQKRIVISTNVDSSNSLKSSTLPDPKECAQHRSLNHLAVDTSNTLKTSTLSDCYNTTTILPSISTKCPTPSNFSGIFSKKALDTVEDSPNKNKKKSPKSKECILPAASVLCNRDNLENATKPFVVAPTSNKKLHWELLKRQNDMNDIEDDTDAENTDHEKSSSKNRKTISETDNNQKNPEEEIVPLTPSKDLRCLESINKTASESEETKSLKVASLNMAATAKKSVMARRNTIDTVPITQAVSYYKQLEELENFKDLTITGNKSISRLSTNTSVASESAVADPAKVIKYRAQRPRISKKLRAKLMASSPIRVRSAESLMDARLYKAAMIKKKSICVCLHSKARSSRTPLNLAGSCKKSKKINAKVQKIGAKERKELCKKSKLQIKATLVDADKMEKEVTQEHDGNLVEVVDKHPDLSEKAADVHFINVKKPQLQQNNAMELRVESTLISGENSPVCLTNKNSLLLLATISREKDICHTPPASKCVLSKAALKDFGNDRELVDTVHFKTPTKKESQTKLTANEPTKKLFTDDQGDLDRNTSSGLEESPAKEDVTANTSIIYHKEHSSDEQNSSLAENSEPECNKYLKDDDIQAHITASPNTPVKANVEPTLIENVEEKGSKENGAIIQGTIPAPMVDVLKVPGKSFMMNYKIPKLKKTIDDKAFNSSKSKQQNSKSPFKSQLSSFHIPKINNAANDDPKSQSCAVENITDQQQKNEEKRGNNKTRERSATTDIATNDMPPALSSTRTDGINKIASLESNKQENLRTRRKSLNTARSTDLQQAFICEPKSSAPLSKTANAVYSPANKHSPQISNSNMKSRRKSLNIQRRKLDSSTDDEGRGDSNCEDKSDVPNKNGQVTYQSPDLKGSSIKSRRKSVNKQRISLVDSISDDDEMHTNIKENLTASNSSSDEDKANNSGKQQFATDKTLISRKMKTRSQNSDSDLADSDDVRRKLLKARSNYLRLQRQMLNYNADDKFQKECIMNEEQLAHSVDFNQAPENISPEPKNNRAPCQNKTQRNPQQNRDQNENSSNSIKMRRKSMHSLEQPESKDIRCEKSFLGSTNNGTEKDKLAKNDKPIKMRRKSMFTESKISKDTDCSVNSGIQKTKTTTGDETSAKSMGKTKKSSEHMDKKTLVSSDDCNSNFNPHHISETTTSLAINQQLETLKHLRVRRKSVYVEKSSLSLAENEDTDEWNIVCDSEAKEGANELNDTTKPLKRRKKSMYLDTDSPKPMKKEKVQDSETSSNHDKAFNRSYTNKAINTTNSSCIQATTNSTQAHADEDEKFTQDVSRNEKPTTDAHISTTLYSNCGDKSAFCAIDENKSRKLITQSAGLSSKCTKSLRTRSKSIYIENPNCCTSQIEENIILTSHEEATVTPSKKDTGHQSDSDTSTIIRNINISKMRRKSLNMPRRILDSSGDENEDKQIPFQTTVIKHGDNIVRPPPEPVRPKRLPRKRRTVKVLSTSHEDPYVIKKSNPNLEECLKTMSPISPTFNHPIFHTQVRDEPQPNINNLTPLSHDDRFNDIDSTMQDMFRSPQREPDVNAQPTAIDAVKTMTVEHVNDSNANVTIDETVCSYRENEQSSLNISEMPVSKSLNSTSSHNQSEPKHLSLGSSEYRFEKVSENVVNLFISRKRKRKRTN